MFTLHAYGVQKFCRQHPTGMLMAEQATSDYAACRCLLSNGLFAGLVSGAQAIEKYMKSFLLFKKVDIKAQGNPDYRKYVKNGHDLPGWANWVRDHGLDLSAHSGQLEALRKHYNSRYPDSQDRSQSASTGELAAIDALILCVYDALPIPAEVRLGSSIYARLTGPDVWPEKTWLLYQNQHLLGRLGELSRRKQEWDEHHRLTAAESLAESNRDAGVSST